MKNSGKLFLALALLLAVSTVQSAPARPAHPAPAAERTDVYHVLFMKAALGKAAQLGDFFKSPNPNTPMPTHYLALRHQDGEDWDYAVIQHMGTKATIDATSHPMPPSVRSLGDWHTDTFVSGPSWPEFTRAMGIDADSVGKTHGNVYVISVYRAAPGQMDDLEKMLSAPPPTDGSDTSVGRVLMQHIEGGAWQYLGVVRYNSWHDFGTNESNVVAKTDKGSGGWFDFRNYCSYHADTVTARIAP